MKIMNCLYIAVSFLVVTTMLTACNSDPKSSIAVKSFPVKNVDIKNAVVNRENMVTTKSSGYSKPGAGVGVEYQLPKEILPGQVVEFVLTLSSQPGSGSLGVELGSEGVQIISQQVKENGDGLHNLVATIYCPDVGRHYLNLFVSRTSAQGDISRQVSSVPMQVGSVVTSKAANKNLEKNADGILIRSLPAKETVYKKE